MGIHWGNAGRPSYTGKPRIALSFGFSTDDFEPPYFSRKSLPFPPLRLRVALAAAQVLNYATLANTDTKGWAALAGGLAGSSVGTLTMLHRAFQRHAKAFHPTYRTEISKKFVAVSIGAHQAPVTSPQSSPSGGGKAKALGKRKAQDDDWSDEDDALEAMLQAESATGEVLFHDDFDMLNAGTAVGKKSGKKFGKMKRSKKGRLGKASSKQ